MSLAEQLKKDMIQAMKSKDSLKLSTLRLVKAALTHYQIEKRKEKLEDPDCLEILQKQIKQRRDSIESYEKAGRTELANKEKEELAILSQYMPAQMSDDDIRAEIQKAMQATGASTKNDSGKLMKVLMPIVKGKADGKRVQEIVASFLR